MIKLLNKGRYRLIETKSFTRILYLDSDAYAWVEFEGVGELLVATLRQHSLGAVLSEGRFRLYDVEDEPHLVDHQHLELEVGSHEWQGYLLITGLPDSTKIRTRIIPTHETITTGFLLRESDSQATTAAN